MKTYISSSDQNLSLLVVDKINTILGRRLKAQILNL